MLLGLSARTAFVSEPKHSDSKLLLRKADLHLDRALAETSHEHFASAQAAVDKLGQGVQLLEQLAPAMGAPDSVKKP